MPKASQKSGYFRKKKTQQKYGKKGNKNLFRQVRPYGVVPDPFPTRLHTRCKYIATKTMTASAATAHTCGNEQVYRLTSIYDSDLTGTGETVVGHSNFNNLYEKYIVKGAKIEVKFSNPTADGMIAFCSLNQTALLQGKIDSWCMQDSLTYSSNLNNTGSQKHTFNFYVNPWSLRGLSKLEWMANKSDHSAALAANPTQDIYLRCAVSGKTLSSQMRISVKIIYYTEFFDRKQLTASTF